VATAVLVGAAAGTVHAGGIPVLIDFETDGSGNAIGNGQVIDNEFDNLFNLSSSGANHGLGIFDTTPGLNFADEDLWVDTGNALILQEHPTQSNGFFTVPDDDADGGSIVFDFLGPAELMAIDLIDIDTTDQFVTIILTDDEGLSRTYFVPDDWTGDIAEGEPGIGTLDLAILGDQIGFNSTATVTEDAGFTETDVMRLEVQLGGSAAIDNLDFIASSIPAPSALTVLLLGLGLSRRRRQ
jgi:uncharacterized protein (TIGR03382 family)